MAITVVQSVFFVNSSGGSFPNPVTAGNTVLLALSGYDTTDPFTINTSNPTLGGNPVAGSQQLIQKESGWDGSLQSYAVIWMLPNCGGGSAAVSLTYNGNLNGNVGLYAVEVAGLGTYPILDQSAGNSGTSGGASSGTTGQTIWADEFVLAVSNHNDGNPPGVPAGYTGVTQGSGTTVYGYQIATTAGNAYTWAPDSAGNGWAAVIVTIAPTLIQYNTGVAVSTDNATSINFTVPNTGGLNGTGVEIGDAMLATVSVFTEDSAQPTVSLSGTGGNWSLVPMTDGSTNPQLSQSGAIYCYNFAYMKVATSSDIGSTITMSETGSAAGTTWLGVAMAAYTGANSQNPIDRAGGATDNNVTDGATCPSESARIAGDWAVYLCGGGFNFGATPTPPAGITQRQFSLNGGATGAAIADSNAPIGLNTVGGGSYTNNGFGPAYLSAFTILLAPAGIYTVQTYNSGGWSGNLTENTTPGNTLFMFPVSYDAPANTSSSNPRFNGSSVPGTAQLWSVQSTSGNNDMYSTLWMLPNLPSAGVNFTITVAGGLGPSPACDNLLLEVLGLGSSPISDQVTTAFGSFGNSNIGPTGAIQYTNEIVLASGAIYGAYPSDGPGSPWSNLTDPTNQHAIVSWQFTSTANNTYSWSEIGNGSPWAGGVATVAVSNSTPYTPPPSTSSGLTMVGIV